MWLLSPKGRTHTLRPSFPPRFCRKMWNFNSLIPPVVIAHCPVPSWSRSPSVTGGLAFVVLEGHFVSHRPRDLAGVLQNEVLPTWI